MSDKRYISECSELMKEWDYENNVNVDPFQIKIGSNKKVWWKCSKHKSCNEHNWDASIKHRTNGRGCPYCAHKPKHICSCDSFPVNFPYLLDEWDYANNKTDPYDLSFGSSNTSYWWKCNKTDCDHHIWQATIRDRTIKGTGCPFCKGIGKSKKLCACSSLKETHSNLLEDVPYKI